MIKTDRVMLVVDLGFGSPMVRGSINSWRIFIGMGGTVSSWVGDVRELSELFRSSSVFDSISFMGFPQSVWLMNRERQHTSRTLFAFDRKAALKLVGQHSDEIEPEPIGCLILVFRQPDPIIRDDQRHLVFVS
jgi:hypothetical protein